MASTLLGTEPPRLPVAFLVRTGALFGLSDGAVRTALSRMVAAGEASSDGDGWYRLTGALAARQDLQRSSRLARTVEWSGRWRMAVVVGGARSAADRAQLRRVMRQLRLAELRDGVWLRPDNLARAEPSGAGGGDPLDAPSVAVEQCQWFGCEPELTLARSDAELAAELWDLPSWASAATELRRGMHLLVDRLDAGDTSALAEGFVLSAAVLRHFLADPLLPRELRPRDWPGEALRRDYDRYDAAYRSLLARWNEAGRDDTTATVVG